MKRLSAIIAFVVLSTATCRSIIAAMPLRTGTVEFAPTDRESELPEHFRLQKHRFDFEQKFVDTSSTEFEMSTVTFPSPVTTPHPNNNTVHCECFCPLGEGRHPGVLVLHILGGDFELSRLFCRALAARGCCALFVKLPYYGPRRQPDSPARMISLDPDETVRGMTQAILDIRRATAWLAAQPGTDPDQLGIMGISLGGITSALAITAEPRLTKACLLLAGGDISQVAWEAKELAGLREKWTKMGGTKESLAALLKKIDPVTYGANVKGRKILMLNASHDEVIPRACTDSLWQAFGKPQIVWWDAGHYTALRFIFEALGKTTKFFAVEAE